MIVDIESKQIQSSVVPGRVEGKVLLVTVATSGIGAAAARLLAAEGARVVLAGRREAEGNAVAEKIVGDGGVAIFVKTDVSREEDVERLVGTAVGVYGRIDGAFNNAGTEGVFGPTDASDSAAFDETIAIN